ncbi:MAG TPA: hypothetical protein VE093_18365 [Polyangiaceae bacterium]|jgi:hypothetical protein|nr:hypothetical protein [Polyangiaceae bacterium]
MNMIQRLRALALLVALPLLACSGSDASSSSTTGATGGMPDGGPADASPGDPSILAGTFQVRLVAPVPAMNGEPETAGYAAVLGKVYDGPTPSQIVWEKGTKDGACQLLTPRVPFCSTPCGGSAVCVEDEMCQPYPSAHSVGKVTAKGLKTESGATEFSMQPIANNYQTPAGLKLLYPPFAEGDNVTFEASGDHFSAFSVQSTGISPLEITSASIAIEKDLPIKLTWTPPGKAGTTTIHVKLDISHHGGTKGLIECDTEDTGSLELSAAILTELVNLGVAGFPTISVMRRAVGSTTIAPGRVELVVASDVERPVQIPGLTSCTDDTQCPSGQTCQQDLTCK